MPIKDVKGKYKETWKALEKLYKDGLVRAIGVSNFNIHHLEDVMSDVQIKPMVNQVEYHPRLTQTELRNYCKKNNINLKHGHLLCVDSSYAWTALG